ncbi:MAG: type II secretion system F family protein [Gammaproteobacteria bacterium]|nr:type II secretion system F family protein [Gammaproteobacteria bacterium]
MQFRIKALNPAHAVLSVSLDAVDEADARRLAGTQGLRVISIAAAPGFAFGGRGRRIPLVTFSQELISLLDAGLPLVEAIETLTEKEANPGVKRTLDQILARLFEGQTLAAALAEHPESFPALYVATVRASERTGAITEALGRYVAYQQQVDLLRKSLVNASIYPAVLGVVGVLVMFFLMGYVVPRFSAIYEDLGQDLPLASRLLLKWGQLLEAHAAEVAIAAVAGVAVLVWLLVRPATRAFAGRLLACVPALGRQLHVYQLSRLYRTTGMLVRGGIPVVPAFQMSEGLLGENLRPAFRAATREIAEGRSIADVLEHRALTTPVAARMLRVGERSGNMGEMMERIAAFYDEELSRFVAVATRLIEPALMALIGIVIGVIVVLMYFPIFELAGSIK